MENDDAALLDLLWYSDFLTEATAEDIRQGEPHKGGYVTPCDGWVDRHTITNHAATCRVCRDMTEQAIASSR